MGLAKGPRPDPAERRRREGDMIAFLRRQAALTGGRREREAVERLAREPERIVLAEDEADA